VLDLPSITTLELLATTAVAIFNGDHDEADSKLPELLAHPMFNISAESLWRLSLAAQRNHLSWLESMLVTPELKPIAEWLIEQARAVPHTPHESYIDTLVGVPTGEDTAAFRSPFYEYYFSAKVLEETPDAYITVLEALRTLRTRLREYQPHGNLRSTDFLEFIRMHRELGSGITSIRSSSAGIDDAVCLLTAHKSKGLEYDTVYIINSVDSKWGERVRSRSPLISYPENLVIKPNSDTYDERLRLYFVAMTRAKRQLFITYSLAATNSKETLAASFLTGTTIPEKVEHPAHTIETLTALNTLAWHDRITEQPTDTMKRLLEPMLETYKLSSTHLNNFIDISRGGPAAFLMNNLLRFPQAKSASASYGTAVHATLQRAHTHLVATGERRPLEDVLGDFVHELERQRLSEEEFSLFSKKGSESLTAFLAAKYPSFTRTQRTELNFANQGVYIGDAHLTGSMDLVDIADDTITVTDYKTGKPSSSWKGSTDYEKIKLHKYKQQLMFYQLLCEHSRDYSKYEFAGGILQFVEPDSSGAITALEEQFSDEELTRFTTLIAAVWHCIRTLDFPDSSQFEPNYKGVLAFEQYLIDNYTQHV
jgi:DNA helicase-2/ATP-dependent DNA helicase PcrA